MGCDIHCWLEYRKPGEGWTLQKRSPCIRCMTKSGADCYRCEGTGFTELRHLEDEDNRLYGGNCYSGRNYTLFAVLAGVRSYGDFEPVFPDRGVPEDASPEFKQLVEDEGEDGHSHSYLNFTEVHMAAYGIADFTQVDLAKQVSEHIREFWEGTVQKQMKPYADELGPENVRIVFFFDN